MIFDGKKFAREIEQQVRELLNNERRISNIVRKPRIVSILVGDDPASVIYTRLKKEAAERVGISFEIVKVVDHRSSIVELKQKITEIGEKEDVTGVMVQLPILGLQGQTLQDVLSAIPLTKDVDGLRWEESGIKPATVRAILAILEQIADRKSSEHLPKITQGSELWGQKFVVVGARGAVGRPLVHFLRERGVEVSEVEWDTPEPTRRVLVGEVVISCVGKAQTVTEDMVNDGVVAIDVGMSIDESQSSDLSPRIVQGSELRGRVVGDMTKEVYQKASISVQVPGGVGPVTIACLMANATDLVL